MRGWHSIGRWPSAGAAMTIDGQVVAGFNVESFEKKLKPGRHEVHISRPGFLTFNQTVDLVPGVNPLLRPIWRPAPTTVAIDPKPTTPNATTPNVTPPKVAETPVPTETKTPSAATNPQPAKKQPAPPVAEQEQVAKQLDELYKISRPGSKDAAKAQELYDVAGKPGASPVERYMLLLKGAEIAAVAGDLSLSMQGIDTLDGDYEINALEIKQKLFDKFVTATKPDQLAISIPTAEQLIDQAIAADQYAIALTLSTTTSRAVTKSKIATRKEVEERLSRRRRDIHVLEPIHAAVKKAQETLDKNPADPEANTIVGRWRCLFKSDWTAGLPLLAKGSDEKLKALAAEDIKGPTEPAQLAQLADGWWDVAQKEAGMARDSLRLHAGDLYQLALPNLASALKKAAIEKRMAEVANLPRPTVAMAPKPAVALDPFPTAKTPSASSAAPVHFTLGQWVDVLQMVDIPRDRIAGTWKRDDTDLDCGAGEQTRLELPVVVNGGYDLEIEFTRTKGNADVVALLSIGGHSCMVTLNGFSGLAGGLMYLDGRDANNPANPIVVRPCILENDHRYRMLVSVRLLPNGRASLDFSLDGKPYLPHWEGDPSQLSDYWAWELANPNRLGFGASRSEVSFHSARLRMVSGQATSVAGAAKSNLQHTSSDKPAGPVAFPRGVWVDVLRLVDTSRDRVEGIWTWNGNELSCKAVPFSRIGIPVSIDGGYDLEVEFTRTVGWGDVATIVSAGSHQCTAVMSAWGGQVSGLAVVEQSRHQRSRQHIHRSARKTRRQASLPAVGQRSRSRERSSYHRRVARWPALPAPLERRSGCARPAALVVGAESAAAGALHLWLQGDVPFRSSKDGHWKSDLGRAAVRWPIASYRDTCSSSLVPRTVGTVWHPMTALGPTCRKQKHARPGAPSQRRGTRNSSLQAAAATVSDRQRGPSCGTIGGEFRRRAVA